MLFSPVRILMLSCAQTCQETRRTFSEGLNLFSERASQQRTAHTPMMKHNSNSCHMSADPSMYTSSEPPMACNQYRHAYATLWGAAVGVAAATQPEQPQTELLQLLTTPAPTHPWTVRLHKLRAMPQPVTLRGSAHSRILPGVHAQARWQC